MSQPGTDLELAQVNWNAIERRIYQKEALLPDVAVFHEIVAYQVEGTGECFPIKKAELVNMMLTKDFDALSEYGGTQGLADLLKTNLQNGIGGDDDDLLKRRNEFGSNVYPPNISMSHPICHITRITVLLLSTVFVGSFAMGVMQANKIGGWNNELNVCVAAALLIFMAGMPEYIQALLQRMNITKQEMGNTVLRVPADGILIDGYSLAIDSFRVAGESNIFQVDPRKPFLRSGWKVADGCCTMLITAVGESTELGILRASTNSKNTNNKTYLQALLGKVATNMCFVGFEVAVFVAFFVWFRNISTDGNSNGCLKPGSALDQAIQIWNIAVDIFVAALGLVLPLALQLNRLSAIRMMKADDALVRRPAVCETLALCTDVLCDKTVLTLNQENLQPGIKESVRTMQNAGLKVRLVIRDDLSPFDAERFGILDSGDGLEANDEIIDGESFEKLSIIKREEVAPKILVMTRASPRHKFLFVQALRRVGKVVAVTGSVDDDAWAIHEADIGIAMGVQGTAVAKESSDIIILDDSFATISKSVKWGRSMHKCTLRVMQLVLAANIAASTANCVAVVLNCQTPLNDVKFLWINVIILGLGPLSLAFESPADDLMTTPPIDGRQSIRKYIRWKELLWQVAPMVTTLVFIDVIDGRLPKNYTTHHTVEVKNTMLFNRFIFCLILIESAIRTTGMVNHPVTWLKEHCVFGVVVLVIIVNQFLITKYMGNPFSVVSLSLNEWKISLLLGIPELYFKLVSVLNT